MCETSAPTTVTRTAARTDAPRLAYQPALDGLRAVAVVSVILFHNGVSWMPGGFLGVDVFFVLSGYLITTLLLLEWRHPGGVDLKAFWTRRARRLLPALLLVLVAVSAYARFAADPATVDSLRWDGIGSLFYVANWRFVFSHQSYFEAFSAPSPLRHLWSLAVEEQWYLVWPLFLSVGLSWSKRSVKPLVAVMGALALLSAGEMFLLTLGSGDPSRAYYGTDTRAHTLLVGAILAVVLNTWPVTQRRARIGVQLLGAAGLVGVVGFMVFVHESDRWMYHGGFLLLALCTAAVIAAVMLPIDGLAKRALRLRALPAIGLLSYGLYLWHWPVNVWLTPERLGLGEITWFGQRVEGYVLVAVRVAVTAAVALASYKFVELPIRHGALGRLRGRMRRPFPVGPALTGGAVAVVAVLVLSSAVGVRTDVESKNNLFAGGELGVPKSERAGTAGERSKASAAAVTTVPIASIEPNPDLPAVAPDHVVKTVIAGDSAGWTLSFTQHQPLPDIQVFDRAILGCGIIDTPYFVRTTRLTFDVDCSGQPVYWQGAAAEQPDVLGVMVGAWEVYDHEVDGKRVGPGDPAYARRFTHDLTQAVDAMIAAVPGIRVVFIGQACFQERNDKLGGVAGDRNDTSRLRKVNAVIKDVAAHYGSRATYIDMGPWLCPGGKFKADVNGVEMRPDGVHFSDQSAAIAWQWLGPKILDFARRPTR